MSNKPLRIATRKSPLAIWQADYVRNRLITAHPGLEVELVRMSTQGDRVLDSPLAKVGGKGLFVKELEEGLLSGQADLAVHSMKDVPVELPEGLHLPVICEREDPRDAFISGDYFSLDDLPQGAKVGTSSLRRQCQIKSRRPDLQILSLRGNVNTRLAKLDNGDFDAIILAAAGLLRLGFAERITTYLDTTISLPAIGQGAVGIECRRDDPQVNQLIAALNHMPTQIRVSAERAMNHRLEGGCQVPIAGHAVLEKGKLILRGLVGFPNGTEVIRGDISGDPGEAIDLGVALADDLLSRGAADILKAVYADQ